MATNSYPLGEPVHVTVQFALPAGTPLDPTTVVCKVKAPYAAPLVYTYGVGIVVVRDGVGSYHVDITPTVAGIWAYRWIGSGALVAASEQEFYVAPSDFGVTG